MTQHDTPEAVDAVASTLEAEAHHLERQSMIDAFNGIAAMLRRLHKRAVDAEAKVACCRASNTGYLAENDALRFERNNLRAALVTARADALREAYYAMDSLPDDARFLAERRISKLIQPTTTGEPT